MCAGMIPGTRPLMALTAQACKQRVDSAWVRQGICILKAGAAKNRGREKSGARRGDEDR